MIHERTECSIIKLSIVIPCYNEYDNLSRLFKRISLFDKYEDIEFILVENGSTDDSRKYILERAKKKDNIKIVLIDRNQGYGYGIQQGLKQGCGQYLAWTHADHQVSVCDLIKAYEFLKKKGWKNNYFLKGVRSKESRSFSERFFTGTMGLILSAILGKKMYDINGQPNVFPREFLDKFSEAPKDVLIEVFAYYVAQKSGLKEIRFPVKFCRRKSGKSKLLPSFDAKFNTIKNTIMYAVKLKENDKNNCI